MHPTPTERQDHPGKVIPGRFVSQRKVTRTVQTLSRRRFGAQRLGVALGGVARRSRSVLMSLSSSRPTVRTTLTKRLPFWDRLTRQRSPTLAALAVIETGDHDAGTRGRMSACAQPWRCSSIDISVQLVPDHDGYCMTS